MNLKINIKRPQITREEIAANKDFSEVLQRYKASVKPGAFYKTSWFYAGISAAAAVIAAIIFYVQPVSNRHSAGQLFSLAPPLEKVKLSSSVLAVNADEGGSYNYKTGTVINIPAHAFIYKKSGKAVTGKVDLSYREMNDPVEFFLAGIPMDYQTGGKKFAFETAGVFEVYASQKGEELELNPGKQVAITLASHVAGKDFNLYKFNTGNKTWEQQSSETIDKNEAIADKTDNEVSNPQLAALDEKIANKEEELKKSEEDLRNLEASRPFEPRQETKGWERFTVNVKNLKDFPELAIYEDVLFQATDKMVDPAIYSKAWREARLSRKGDAYMLSLRDEDGMTKAVAVRPVFEGEGYITAQKTYKAKMSQYEHMLAELKPIEIAKQQQLKALTGILNDARDSELSREQNKELADNAANPLTFHSITINGWGIWGLNKMTEYPMGANIAAHFTDERGKEIKFANGRVYLVERGRNVLFSYDQNSTIAYNPQKETMLWGVTNDDKLAVFKYEDFKASETISGNYNFVMQVSNVDLADESAVEYFLNI